MPLITDEIIEKGGRLLIWQLTETEDTLKMLPQNVSFAKNNAVTGIKNNLRRKQKLVTGILLSLLGENDIIDLEYTGTGKPFLKNTTGSISFSGCLNYVVVLHHESAETGVDIEERRPKILSIAPKFTNEEELKWIRPDHKISDLHLIWGAKEAAFKLIGGGGIDFKKHLEVIRPTSFDKIEGKGKILFSKHLPIKELPYYFRYLEEYILVFTIV